jgi:transposase
MSGFIDGDDRSQATLFPERLDDYVAEDSAVRVIDVFIDELDISGVLASRRRLLIQADRPIIRQRC